MCSASAATSSSTRAFSTALAGVAPQANGPWRATRTPGTRSASRPAKASTMTSPVASSYAPSISVAVSGRVHGMSPPK